ncbi:MAG: hypothetical protein ACPL7C_10225, partial [Anaerolineae bacterium]
GTRVPGVVRDVLNQAAVTVDVFNRGDYIAKSVRVTVTFASGVTLTATTWPTAAQGADWVAFALPDIPPGAWVGIGLVLEFVPGETGPWIQSPPQSYRPIAFTDGRYVHEFPFAALVPRTVVVVDRLAGPLELRAYTRIWRVYLPLVTRNYRVPWWPQAVP